MARGVRVTAVLVGFWSVMVPGMWVLAPALIPHLLWVTAMIGLVLMVAPRVRERGRGGGQPLPLPLAPVADLAAFRADREQAVGPALDRAA